MKRGSVGTVVPLTCTPSGPMVISRVSFSFFALRSCRSRSRLAQLRSYSRRSGSPTVTPLKRMGLRTCIPSRSYQVKSRFVR